MTDRIQHWFAKGYSWLRGRDLLVLISVLLVVLGLWSFLELAEEVNQGDLHEIDDWMIRALRNPADLSDPLGPPWLDDAVRDVTALGSTVVLVLVSAAVAIFLAVRRQFHALGFLVVAIAGAFVLNSSLKNFYNRPRPNLVPHLMRATNPSFPSGHSLHSAAVYLALGALVARLVKPIKLKLYVISIGLGLSFLVGISRVYLGVHYPSDVLAGWTVGLVWAIICWLVARYLQRRGAVERPKREG